MTFETLSNRDRAVATALESARAQCPSVDLPAQFHLHEIEFTPAHGSYIFNAFGRDVALTESDFLLYDTHAECEVDGIESVLLFRLLVSNAAPSVSDAPVSFRDFPGGAFYLGPFTSRTASMLTGRFGGNIGMLNHSLRRFRHRRREWGDYSASIAFLGGHEVTIVYRAPDDEFAPEATILFDPSLKRIYTADEASALAARICVLLVRESC